jgi:nucleoside-diphosphate-sugar epimerase
MLAAAPLLFSTALVLPSLRAPDAAVLRVAAAPQCMAAALEPGDKVAVVGASGNVGKLVALRLSDSFKVTGVSRNPSRVRDFLPSDKVELAQADLDDPAALEKALSGAQACVICTGTTAFPTQAWSKSGEEGVFTKVLKALSDTEEPMGEDLNALDIIKLRWQAMIRTLDGEGYNTPVNVDEKGTLAILKAWEAAAGASRKRLVMLSSIGVQRRTQMPFPVLNACGVLDAKAAGEAAIQADAAAGGYAYTIVRPGQLFGGPYDNNYYLGTLFQLDKDAETQDVEVARGDTLLGDTLRSTLAEVTAQLMESGSALDLDFAVVNQKGEPPSVEQVRQRLAGL